MNWKNIVLATIVLLAMTSVSAASVGWTANIDINGINASAGSKTTFSGTTTGGVLCGPDDRNISISIADINADSGVFVTFNDTIWTGVRFDANTDQTVSGATNTDFNLVAVGATKVLRTAAYVAVPTAEKLYTVCVYDINSCIGCTSNAIANYKRYYCETIGVRPDATYTGYTITNSDGNDFCVTSNYSAFTGKIEDSTGYGRIETDRGETWDLSGDIDYDAGIVWSNSNKFNVTLSQLVGQVSKVTFLKPNIHTAQFQIRRNDSGCSICDDIASNNGQISFTTTSFSTYEVVEAPSDGVTTGGGAYQPASLIPDVSGILSGTGLNNTTAVIIIIIIVVVALLVIGKKKK